MIHAITSSELASVAGMINFNGQSFCDTTVSKFAEYTKALGDLAGESLVLSDYTNAVVSIVASDELQATLLTSIPGQVPQEQVFTKIEGRWVPMEMANGWAAQMAEATASLEAISPESVASQKPQMMGILTMIDGVLTQIAAAETQEQFDQSLQGAMMPLMGLMMMGQGLGAPAVPAAPVLK
jgi:hypothetical protein